MPLSPGADELDVNARASWISSTERGGQSRVGRGGGSSGWAGETVLASAGKNREARDMDISSWERASSPGDEDDCKGGMREDRQPWRQRVASHSFVLAV